MKSTDFRIGNLVYYHIEDKMDEREAWDEISPIDHDDLRCLEQYEDNSEYRPIPLTDKILLDAGFKSLFSGAGYHKNGVEIGYNHNGFYIISTGLKIEFVHEIQNLYWCLRGEEIIIKIV